MTNGGYPEVVTKYVEPRGYLDTLFDAVLFKDVIKRHKVRFSKQIDDLGSYLINNVSNPYTARKLAKPQSLKSDVRTAKYLGYLTEAYLLFSLDRHSTKVGDKTAIAQKTYVVDNGLDRKGGTAFTGYRYFFFFFFFIFLFKKNKKCFSRRDTGIHAFRCFWAAATPTVTGRDNGRLSYQRQSRELWTHSRFGWLPRLTSSVNTRFSINLPKLIR